MAIRQYGISPGDKAERAKIYQTIIKGLKYNAKELQDASAAISQDSTEKFKIHYAKNKNGLGGHYTLIDPSGNMYYDSNPDARLYHERFAYIATEYQKIKDSNDSKAINQNTILPISSANKNNDKTIINQRYGIVGNLATTTCGIYALWTQHCLQNNKNVSKEWQRILKISGITKGNYAAAQMLLELQKTSIIDINSLFVYPKKTIDNGNNKIPISGIASIYKRISLKPSKIYHANTPIDRKAPWNKIGAR